MGGERRSLIQGLAEAEGFDADQAEEFINTGKVSHAAKTSARRRRPPQRLSRCHLPSPRFRSP